MTRVSIQLLILQRTPIGSWFSAEAVTEFVVVGIAEDSAGYSGRDVSKI